MIALVPIFIKSNKKLWLSADGQKLMRQTLESLQTSQQFSQHIVFTDMEIVAQLAAKMKFEVQIIRPEYETDAPVLLPRGTLASIKFIRKKNRYNDEHLGIFNFRNPLITQPLIDKAIREFIRSDLPLLLSVKKAVDHPVQLERFFKIVEVGILHLFERQAYSLEDNLAKDNVWLATDSSDCQNKADCKRTFWVTKPFFFDWDSRGVAGGPKWRIFERHIGNQKIDFKPVTQSNGSIPKQPTRALWIYDDKKSARLLVIAEEIGPNGLPVNERQNEFRLRAVALSDDYTTLRHRLFFDRKKRQIHLNLQFDEVPSGPHTLKLVQFNSTKSAETSDSVEIEIEDLAKPVILNEPKEATGGMIYTLLRTINDGSYDFREPFPPQPDLWAIDKGSGKKINCVNGKEVTGRQDFPDVFVPDGAFYFMAKNMNHPFEIAISGGDTMGFVIGRDDSIQINSVLDFLRYRAITRVQRETIL
jgi:CMP-N-acetylneuraminic acid synthetase